MMNLSTEITSSPDPSEGTASTEFSQELQECKQLGVSVPQSDQL